MSLLRRFELSRGSTARPLATTASGGGVAPGPDASAGTRIVEHRETARSKSQGLSRAWRRATGTALPLERGTVVFVDTETTGLSHAQLPFVLGALALDLQTGEMELAQWALRSREAEVTMLRHFVRWLDARPVGALSSFNGASFDLPLLRRRLSRLALPEPKLLARGSTHLDLLHLGRRLWRDRLPDCRLQTLEAARLGRKRRGDIPSALIPAVFTDFLARPTCSDARAQLERVEHHNRLDLWSLPELLEDFGNTLQQPNGWSERLRVSRHFIELGQTQWARPVLESRLVEEIESLRPGRLRARPALRAAALEAATLARRRDDRAYCTRLLRALHAVSPSDPELCERYAIHLEHKLRDFAAALEVAEASRLPQARRIARLRDRCERAGLLAPRARATGEADAATDAKPHEQKRAPAVSKAGVISSPGACLRRPRSDSGLALA